MQRFILATVAGAALLTGATAASAQTFYGDSYAYGGGYAYGDGYASTDGYVYNRGPLIERGVGLQIGPVGVYPTYPTYSYGYRDHTIRPERDVTVNPRETQYYPQSPGTPGGN